MQKVWDTAALYNDDVLCKRELNVVFFVTDNTKINNIDTGTVESCANVVIHMPDIISFQI
jgi:hypothetical protein